MFVRLVRWVLAQWRKYCSERELVRLDHEIRRTAVTLGLVDLGLPRQFRVSDEGEPLVRMHFACPIPARVGVTQSPTQLVYWCFRCKVTWHSDDDDGDDKGGRKPRGRSPLRPNGWHPQPGLGESEEVIRRIMQKKSSLPVEH